MKKAVKFSIGFCIAMLLCVTFVCVCYASEADIYYGKSTLSENEQYVYGLLEENVLCEIPQENIEIDKNKGLTYDELARAVNVFLSDRPDCFWMENGIGYSTLDNIIVSISPSYSFPAEEVASARDRIEAQIVDIFQSMPEEIMSGNDYDKALYLHDVVVSRVVYKREGHHQTVYGALVDGKSVCAGYTSAYQLLLQVAGIKAWSVSGQSVDPSDGQPEAHAWTVMWIDGKCLYTDVTWDDQNTDTYHGYFAISLEEMGRDHFVDETVYALPECGHEGMSYFDVTGKKFSTEDSVEKFASFFKKKRESEFYAEFVCENGNPGEWMEENILDVFDLLGGVGGVTYLTSHLGNEYHVTLQSTDIDYPTEAPSEAPTESQTEMPTEILTEKPTEKPTENTSSVPTETATDVSAEEPSESSTEEQTSKPEDFDTEKATEKNTDASTVKPDDGLTEKPTAKPSQDSSNNSGTSRGCQMSAIGSTVALVTVIGTALVAINKKRR